MGKNTVEGMTNYSAALKKYEPSQPFRQETKVINRRGARRGVCKQVDEPKTPFAALRMVLKLTQREWSEICGISAVVIYNIEQGKGVTNIAVAKRMQDEARKRGVAITLDELYQHVIPWVNEDDLEIESDEIGMI